MKKLYKLVCSNCGKGLGTLFLEDELNHPRFINANKIFTVPFLLPNEVYEDKLKSLSISNDIISPIYCSDCADAIYYEEDED